MRCNAIWFFKTVYSVKNILDLEAGVPETVVFSTILELEEHRIDCFKRSEQAVTENPSYYRDIKKLLTYVVSNPVDISEYEDLAGEIASLLENMGKDTIFYHYFYENIHPGQYGVPKFLRFFCRDLLDQLSELNRWRRTFRNITCINE